jgi:hypothetical protein
MEMGGIFLKVYSQNKIHGFGGDSLHFIKSLIFSHTTNGGWLGFERTCHTVRMAHESRRIPIRLPKLWNH